MIFDRTQLDVENAKKIRDNKVKKFIELSENDLQTLEKGFFTINTANRIESALKEIFDFLVDSGYNVIGETKEWTYDGIFDETEFIRILDNLNLIKSVIKPKKTTPSTPAVGFSYSILNDIEKIIFDLKTLEENSRKAVFYSGELFTSEV